MTEAVNRLELIADEEQLLRRAGAEQVDEVGLEAVRVLELVDHDRAEAELLDLPDGVVLAQQLAGTKLQILEVERRLAILGLRVGGGEAGEQLLEQLAVAGGQLLERERPHNLPGIAEGSGARAADRGIRKLDEALRQPSRLEQIEHVARGRA